MRTLNNQYDCFIDLSLLLFAAPLSTNKMNWKIAQVSKRGELQLSAH